MDSFDISDAPGECAPPPAAKEEPPKKLPQPPVAWKDARFQPAIDNVRSMCGLAASDREDDPIIGMLLDRYSWDEKRVCELYRRSLTRRQELGVDKVKHDIVSGNLALDQLPHAAEVRQVISINGSSSIDKASAVSGAGAADCLIDGKQVRPRSLGPPARASAGDPTSWPGCRPELSARAAKQSCQTELPAGRHAT